MYSDQTEGGDNVERPESWTGWGEDWSPNAEEPATPTNDPKQTDELGRTKQTGELGHSDEWNSTDWNVEGWSNEAGAKAKAKSSSSSKAAKNDANTGLLIDLQDNQDNSNSANDEGWDNSGWDEDAWASLESTPSRSKPAHRAKSSKGD